MNIGDQLTWGYRSLLIIALIWYRFFEQIFGSTLMWVIWVLVVFLLFYIPARRKKSRQMAAQTESDSSG